MERRLDNVNSYHPKTGRIRRKKQEFVVTEEQTLVLEHSLVSLSKWEAKHNIPFMTKKEKNGRRNARLYIVYDCD